MPITLTGRNTACAIIRILRGLFLGLDWQGMNRLDEMQGVVFRIQGHEVTRLEPDLKLS